jgi:hypothetical protein
VKSREVVDAYLGTVVTTGALIDGTVVRLIRPIAAVVDTVAEFAVCDAFNRR